MSQNPFASDIPFSSPPVNLPQNPSPQNPLVGPAIVLLVTACLTLLLLLGSLPGQYLRLREVDLSTSEGMGELAGGVCALVVWFLLNVAIVIGSVNMLRLRGYTGAYTAAILALIPFCSPCFVVGIPFGIWSLVVLNRPEVKSLFR